MHADGPLMELKKIITPSAYKRQSMRPVQSDTL